MHKSMPYPEILAPAGDMSSAIAGLAAGADALYIGLKHFSARMQAENFSTSDLAKLVELAHSDNKRIYVAMNTMLKPDDGPSAARLVARTLQGSATPDALIIQDPGMINLARQAGYEGELHLSTLANVTHPLALQTAKDMGASRVIIPRELSIDEVRMMDAARPEGLDLEIFVHGALCYCVSGRCWWSSYMGGKSGLRGRCVQPCRRVYKQKSREARFFSCQDLSIDVLSKTLLEFPGIASWKIEGRKKGPHYVYYATTAYRMLRDEGQNPAVRKEAEQLLELALGRPRTRSNFLPQKNNSPVDLDSQTSSGLLCGKILKDPKGIFSFKPRFELIPQDFLRIGTEDESWHSTVRINRRVPKGGSFTLILPRHKTPRNGTPVYLIDRREPELTSILNQWEKRLQQIKPMAVGPNPFGNDPDDSTGNNEKNQQNIASFSPALPKAAPRQRSLDVVLYGYLPRGRDGKSGIKPGTVQGLWLSGKSLTDVSRTLFGRISWWLPPVIWPDEEEGWKKMIAAALRNGARHFVCNAPWQLAFFDNKKDLSLTAGPFCNIANSYSIAVLAKAGFSSVIVSPELSGEDLLSLPSRSSLPLGIVLAGFWPMGISRHSGGVVKPGEIFTSPKNEGFWLKKYGQNTWIYPHWPLDIKAHRSELEKAGYSTFISIEESIPSAIGEPKRQSEFNWDIGVL